MDYPKSVPSVGLVSGKFVDENPATGTPGSLIHAQWGNSVTQEILNAMAAGGEQPDETRTDQLAAAITQIGSQVRQAYKGAGFGYTASETLLPGVTGHWHRINVAGITLTLPSKANVMVGKSVTFHNASTGAATIKASGTEVISLFGSGSNTLRLNAAEWVELVFNPDAIYITKRGKITEVAGIDSPVLTGDPKTPTAAPGDNDLSIANTAFVQAALNALGMGTNTSLLAADLNLTVQGGWYRTSPTTLNQPLPTNSSVEVIPYNGGGCLQVVTQLGGGSRKFWRTQASGIWTGWREAVSTDDPGLVPNTVVGSARNLIMNVASASASATITADELVVETSLGGMGYRLGAFNKAINLAAVGIGGMDTGVAPTNGFVAVYAIYNPITGVSALLSTDATSTTASEVYTGGNMPAGFTASALVSVWRTKSSLFQIGFMEGREVSFVNEKVAATTVQISGKPLNLASVIPLSTKAVTGWLAIAGINTANAAITVTSSVSGIGFQQVAGNSMSETIQNIATGSFSNLKVITAQTIFWSTGVLTGTFKEGSVNICAYKF
ncbi:pyocin knob domain-containing protein [Pseudomonas syringae pv. actinidifoliorum]|nr:pyocin knob domain-containing protein [Pseudomonas syringae pv. actinidifoliorum]MDU8523082.1 pyocin knob domain-containing protein [Pseudomonas syringae pv. actinidifoliorum]MDU8525575.1 pyocin knob domain-containing protein [Pseudomonas syringae pv. actinidifoliorum]